MINIDFNPKTLELEIKGHANQDVKGKDIVCSAISTLFYTLGQSLIDSASMLKDKLIFEDKDGKGYLKCTPKEEFEGNIARTYWTILEGFQLVAENYEKFVKFEVRG